MDEVAASWGLGYRQCRIGERLIKSRNRFLCDGRKREPVVVKHARLRMLISKRKYAAVIDAVIKHVIVDLREKRLCRSYNGAASLNGLYDIRCILESCFVGDRLRRGDAAENIWNLGLDDAGSKSAQNHARCLIPLLIPQSVWRVFNIGARLNVFVEVAMHPGSRPVALKAREFVKIHVGGA